MLRRRWLTKRRCIHPALSPCDPWQLEPIFPPREDPSQFCIVLVLSNYLGSNWHDKIRQIRSKPKSDTPLRREPFLYHVTYKLSRDNLELSSGEDRENIHFNMNPKGSTRARYYGTNKPHKDKFKGHKGKIRKQELFKSRLKSSQVIDSEITELQSRYAKVSFQTEGLGETSKFVCFR